MQVHLVQFDIAWEDRDANMQAVDRLLTTPDIRPGDLVVLPEMFDSGFSLRTELTADRRGETLAYLAELAEDLGAYVIAGRTVHDCDCSLASNRASVLAPPGAGRPTAGLVAEYTKIHPFTYGREPERFAPGEDISIFDWGDVPECQHPVKVCPLVCYDLRFPELFRLGLSRGTEMFVVIANWPSARQDHWDTLLRARAIENQAFVIGVNRCGDDPHLNYSGGSVAIGPRGDVLGSAGDGESVVSVPIDRAELDAWRTEFPAWRDRRLGSA